MTYLVERLAERRRHLDHLRELRPRVDGRESLERDLSLHNDVLYSLLTVCQLVIHISGELSARRGDRFEDYTRAVRNLARDERFPRDVVERLERLPGFRNVLIHEYVAPGHGAGNRGAPRAGADRALLRGSRSSASARS